MITGSNVKNAISGIDSRCPGIRHATQGYDEVTSQGYDEASNPGLKDETPLG